MKEIDYIFILFLFMSGLFLWSVIDNLNLQSEYDQLELEYGYAMELLDFCLYDPEKAKGIKESIEQYQSTLGQL